MENLKACPICSHKSSSLFLSSKDYFLSNEQFCIERCTSCGFLYTNPRPTMQEIGAYYQSNEYISHSSEGKNLFSKVYNSIRDFSIQSKIRRIKKFKHEGNALDIGSGTGEFLHALSKSGFSTCGIEPNEKAKEFAHGKYGLNISSKLNKEFASSHSFDLITLWHVLEHVHDLKPYMQFINQMLSVGGYVFIALPNFESFDARFYKKHWAAYDLPRHLYHFNKTSLSQLLKQFDLEIIKTFPMAFDSYYVSMLSEKYLNKKRNSIKAFLIGFISNLSAMFNSTNYSSIIYVVKMKKA